ncbi:hypothetical protein OG923_24490 [Streptomyces halstedii]|uniref:hypothetical protein n=1 Tax=Streptomyces halstedii TaxID=1944 RepID=UPI003249DC0C
MGTRLMFGPFRPAPLRYHLRRHPWRYLAHRTGLLCSWSLLFTGVPFSNRWHRRRLAARKARI